MTDVPGRRGLGRGLSALLNDPPPAPRAPVVQERPPEPPSPAPPPGPRAEIPVELIRRNPEQPRRRFADSEMEELTSSVREKGVLQPILVRPAPGIPGEYQIVAGERRWRAAQAARLTTIPAVVRELDDLEVLEIGVIENIQRADLNALEEASGYRSLMERFGRTQEQIATTVGKSRAHVANALRLLSLPESVRDHVVAGRLSAGHARAIATAQDIEGLAERVIAKGLSVRQTEALSRDDGSRRTPIPPSGPAPAALPVPPEPSLPPLPQEKDPDTLALEQDLSSAIGLTVVVEDRGGLGEVRVQYLNLEQLDEICRRLSEA